MPPRRRKKEPVKQTRPSLRALINRYKSGLTSKREVLRRVKRKAPTDETKTDFIELRALAVDAGWVK